MRQQRKIILTKRLQRKKMLYAVNSFREGQFYTGLVEIGIATWTRNLRRNKKPSECSSAILEEIDSMTTYRVSRSDFHKKLKKAANIMLKFFPEKKK